MLSDGDIHVWWEESHLLRAWEQPCELASAHKLMTHQLHRGDEPLQILQQGQRVLSPIDIFQSTTALLHCALAWCCQQWCIPQTPLPQLSCLLLSAAPLLTHLLLWLRSLPSCSLKAESDFCYLILWSALCQLFATLPSLVSSLNIIIIPLFPFSRLQNQDYRWYLLDPNRHIP